MYALNVLYYPVYNQYNTTLSVLHNLNGLDKTLQNIIYDDFNQTKSRFILLYSIKLYEIAINFDL